ncbi:MAG: TnsA endonuclease N-terminal domain-containing protein [Opitutaceae bacterium]|jgi:hypothetical protein
MKRFRFTNIVGQFNFPIANASGKYLSQLERRGGVHLLLEPQVSGFRYSEPRIFYRDAEGKKRRYTGDTLVQFEPSSVRRPLVIEYKYQAELDRKPQLLGHYETISQELNRLGMDFIIRTDLHVLTPDFRVKELICGYSNDPESSVEEDVLRVIQRNGSIAVGVLISQLRSDRAAQLSLVPVVWRLVAQRRAFIDFKFLPCAETVVRSQPFNQGQYL